MESCKLMHKKTGNLVLEMETLSLPQDVANRDPRELFLTSFSVKMVHELMQEGVLKVDTFEYMSGGEKRGYQRSHSTRRSAEFSRYIQGEFQNSVDGGDGWCPTAVTLFVRDRKIVKKSDGKLVLKLNSQKDNSVIYITDGQHRLHGMDHAYAGVLKRKKKADADKTPIANYAIPVVLMIANTDDGQLEEAKIFHTINSKSRRVATNLSQQFILRKMEDMQGKPISLEEKIPRKGTYKDYMPYVVKLVDVLNNTEGVWDSQIIMPNEDFGNKPINQVSFVASIKAFAKTEASKAEWSIQEMKNVIDAYWTAIGRLCPEAIKYWRGNPAPDGSYYLLRTTTGVFSLNKLMTEIVERTSEDFNPDHWQKKLSKAEGCFTDSFWLGHDADGNRGDCAIFGTSMGAFNLLMEYILERI